MKIKDSKFYLLGGMFTILILIAAIVPSLIISNNTNASNKKVISNQRMDKHLAIGKKDLMMKKNQRMDKHPAIGKKDLMMKENAYNGIGAKIKLNSDNETVISFVYKNSPAHNSGIRPGDIIQKINGQSLKSKTLSEVTNLIKNDNSNEIDLLIQHTLSETPISLKITKALINTR
jgi:C-terminal processing protease CtpA/Prc